MSTKINIQPYDIDVYYDIINGRGGLAFACSPDCDYLKGENCIMNGTPYQLWPTGNLDRNGNGQFAPSQTCLKCTKMYD